MAFRQRLTPDGQQPSRYDCLRHAALVGEVMLLTANLDDLLQPTLVPQVDGQFQIGDQYLHDVARGIARLHRSDSKRIGVPDLAAEVVCIPQEMGRRAAPGQILSRQTRKRVAGMGDDLLHISPVEGRKCLKGGQSSL